MLRLYDFLDSGNGYKVRLMLSQLGRRYEYVEVDILAGESRTPEFLRINPNGRIPVIVLDDGRVLSESNAILTYLAEGTRYLPGDAFARAQVLQWLFFEQYTLEPNIAVARFWLKHGLEETNRGRLSEKWKGGYGALEVLEHRLRNHRFLVDDTYTVADIGLYAYTHVADEGRFELGPYPAVRGWMERVREQPGHIPITENPAAR
jgi:glutathione S-transferase